MFKIDFCRTYDYYTSETFVTICYKRKPLTLRVGAGTSDQMLVFRTGWDIIVYSYNTTFDYVGVEVFFEKEIVDRPHPEAPLSVCEHFWQSSEVIQGDFQLRKDWRDYDEINLAKRAYSYIVQSVYG